MNTLSPLAYYQQQCQLGAIFEDHQQLHVLSYLQNIYLSLVKKSKQKKIFKKFQKQKLIQGVYVWGGVGVGKTLLLDYFYESLPFFEKKRMHFYKFMQFLQAALKEKEGEKDPLKVIAKEIAKETWVLCFDELFVSDIADAMLLGRFLEMLFEAGVCLVATSNVKPEDLYKNCLQREKFLPAIELLKKYTTVLHIPTMTDYRLNYLKEAGVFYLLKDGAEEKMKNCFEVLTQGCPVKSDPVLINDRQIDIVKQAGDSVWFKFSAICHVPRSSQDYLAISKQYRTVFVSDIPVFSDENKESLYLFINLVDVFYDARVRMVFSAEDEIENLYVQGDFTFEYERTRSRLVEMQSQSYFSHERYQFE